MEEKEGGVLATSKYDVGFVGILGCFIGSRKSPQELTLGFVGSKSLPRHPISESMQYLHTLDPQGLVSFR